MSCDVSFDRVNMCCSMCRVHVLYTCTRELKPHTIIECEKADKMMFEGATNPCLPILEMGEYIRKACGVMWFLLFYVLQLLWIKFTQQHSCCISKFICKNRIESHIVSDLVMVIESACLLFPPDRVHY